MRKSKVLAIVVGILGIGVYFVTSLRSASTSLSSEASPLQTVSTDHEKSETKNEVQYSSSTRQVQNLSGRGARPDVVPSSESEKVEMFKRSELIADELLNQTSWKVVRNMTAFPKSQFTDMARTRGELNGYVFVEDSHSSNFEAFDSERPIVVFDSSSNRPGIVTGNFEVTLEEGASADFLSQSPDVRVIAGFPDTGIYIVTAAHKNFSYHELLTELRNAPEVKNVNPEILYRAYEKH